MSENEEQRQNYVVLRNIVLGLLAWGVVLGLGAYLFRGQHDYRKPLIIIGCVVLFIGFWGLMLWQRQRKLRK